MAKQSITRRRFLQTSAAAGAYVAVNSQPVWSQSPNEKLNVACVGVGGRGAADYGEVMKNPSVNIVALCDVDTRTLDSAARKSPKAEKFSDYRKMFDRIHSKIDAVVVATPDHMHGPITATAMLLGKHAYTEKPLAHDVFECRMLAELAKRNKLATQMGTQIHAGDNYRRVVELIKGGAIGDVFEAHVWAGKSWSGGRKPENAQPVPNYLDWDLWTGVSPMYPYAPRTYHPSNWRRFWDFGTGTLGDMGCHYADVVYWALDLHKTYPDQVWADAKDAPHPVGTVHALASHLRYPAHGTRKPVTMHWYDGGRRPKIMEEGRVIVGGKPAKWGSGVLFVGTKGMLLCDYGRKHLLPEEQFKGFIPPEPWIAKSIGHHNEWIKACLEGTPTTCNFHYSGQLSEAILLGNVAYRVQKKLAWDGKNIKAPNVPESDELIRRGYRKGWGDVMKDVQHFVGLS